ncbi:hypothetical protein Tco_0640380 [Tanacetum coccineum]
MSYCSTAVVCVVYKRVEGVEVSVDKFRLFLVSVLEVDLGYGFDVYGAFSSDLAIVTFLVSFAVMSSASSTVTYTSVYTDSEPGRVFWGADEVISDGGYVGWGGGGTESNPEEDPEEYEDDETEDGPVDYPMDEGEDRDDDDGNSSGDDADDEDKDEEDKDEEEVEEHLALAIRCSRYEVGEGYTARPTKGRRVDYGFVSTLDAESEREGIREETVLIVEEEAYAFRKAWAHAIGLNQAAYYELHTHREQVHETRSQMQGEMQRFRRGCRRQAPDSRGSTCDERH